VTDVLVQPRRIVMQGTKVVPSVATVLCWWRMGKEEEGLTKVRLRISATVIAIEMVLLAPIMTTGLSRCLCSSKYFEA